MDRSKVKSLERYFQCSRDIYNQVPVSISLTLLDILVVGNVDGIYRKKKKEIKSNIGNNNMSISCKSRGIQ